MDLFLLPLVVISSYSLIESFQFLSFFCLHRHLSAKTRKEVVNYLQLKGAFMSKRLWISILKM